MGRYNRRTRKGWETRTTRVQGLVDNFRSAINAIAEAAPYPIEECNEWKTQDWLLEMVDLSGRSKTVKFSEARWALKEWQSPSAGNQRAFEIIDAGRNYNNSDVIAEILFQGSTIHTKKGTFRLINKEEIEQWQIIKEQ